MHSLGGNLLAADEEEGAVTFVLIFLSDVRKKPLAADTELSADLRLIVPFPSNLIHYLNN